MLRYGKKNTKGKRRHVITQLQLAEEKDINLMGDMELLHVFNPIGSQKTIYSMRLT
jgi:hypothetical protein